MKYQNGQYNLVDLNDKEYHDRLQILSDYWEELKKEIKAVREAGYQNTDIVNMSEIYFKMADETVFAAENYSERIAVKIRTLELLSVLDMLCLVILIVTQTLAAMKKEHIQIPIRDCQIKMPVKCFLTIRKQLQSIQRA